MEPAYTCSRRNIRPPSGFDDYVSRREAALLLGLQSEFKVRQLEKEGRLRAVRGVMSSAWYPRAQVMALRQLVAPRAPGTPSSGRRGPSDADLIACLRQWAAGRPVTVVDLVAETGVGIARAERVYRFWLAHDTHPAAEQARAAAAPGERRGYERLDRAALIRQLRHPDARQRAAAFERLRPGGERNPGRPMKPSDRVP